MEAEKQTFGDRVADRLINANGSYPTFFIFTTIVFGYISSNTLPGFPHYDPYPFGFMTLALSLVANYQSIFLGIAARAQARRDRRTAEANRQIMISQLRLSEAIKTLLMEQQRHLERMGDRDLKIAEELNILLERTEK